YDHAATCYDREYLFQFGEIDPAIHQQAEAQIKAIGACPPGTNNTITGMPCPPAVLAVPTEPYHPRSYTINGRSLPDNFDADHAPTNTGSPSGMADANGYYRRAGGAVIPVFNTAGALSDASTAAKNYGEWCADHNHPREANPVGQVGGGGPATLPDPLIATKG